MKLKWSSFCCAFAGMLDLLKTQRHARWHLLGSVVVVAAGFVCQLQKGEWLALLCAMALVWVAEALNTAIEVACDAITKDQHPLIGRAKDLGAAAVLIAALFAVVIGALVFWPYVFD